MAQPTTADMTGADHSAEGVLPIDKPAGPTSHDMVARARRALGTRRIGHTGTLDPFASGLMLLCIGRATRIAEYLSGMDKRYTAIVRLGISTDTFDATGSITDEHDAAAITRADIENALQAQRGDIQQTPPAYSAKKVDGQRSYTLARQGREVRLEPATVSIHQLTITHFDTPDVHLDVLCSSGTYIRAIARDLGDALGVGAHLIALRRTAVGPHSIEGAVSADDLDAASAVRRAHVHVRGGSADDGSAGAVSAGAGSAGHDTVAAGDDAVGHVSANPFDFLQARIIPTLDALGAMPRVGITDDEIASIRHGRSITRHEATDGVVALAARGELIAIAHAEAGRLRPRKVFL